MPLTPYHFGPGLLLKSVLPKRFSLTAFALTEVAVDVEVAYYLARAESPLHRHLHSLLGASALAVVVGASLVAARGVARRYFDVSRAESPGPSRSSSELSNRGIAVGVGLGALLAVALDALMHSDVHPFWPVTDANPIHGLLGYGVLSGFCVVSGFLGLGIMMIRSASRDDG